MSKREKHVCVICGAKGGSFSTAEFSDTKEIVAVCPKCLKKHFKRRKRKC